MCSPQVNAPGTLATCAPVCPRACQIAKAAPVMSAAIAIRPRSMTSMTSVSSWPPAPLILSAVTSASLVAMYVVQAVGVPGGPQERAGAGAPPAVEHGARVAAEFGAAHRDVPAELARVEADRPGDIRCA